MTKYILCANIKSLDIKKTILEVCKILNIEQKRKEKGLLQSDLARELGVTQGAISQWEKGTTQPAIKYLVRMAQIFSCTVDDLLAVKLTD